jgi:hypothetical protein
MNTLARRLGPLAGIVTLLGSGAYVFVYLYRWEWNRAQVSAAIFVAVEVGLVGWLLAERLRRVERRLELATIDGEARRLHVIRSSAPPARVGFAWLARQDRMSVFIPVLLGAGALLSAVAWVVERVARATAGRVAEHGLAQRLGALDLPPGGLLDPGPDPLALLRGPVAGR